MAEGNLWEEYLDRAREFITSGQMDSEEIDYKLAIGKDLSRAREAVLSGNSAWPELVKKGLSTSLMTWRDAQVLTRWFEAEPDDALQAMQGLWAKDDTQIGNRIRAFVARVRDDPEHPRNFKGAGNRMRTVSVLLMALGPRQYPPFKWTEFTRAYKTLGYPGFPQGADEAEIYEHALEFLDRLVERATVLNLARPNNRLEAQSVVYRFPDSLQSGSSRKNEATRSVPPGTEPTSMGELAEELFLTEPQNFLHQIETLLAEKKQVIFQGPPGTGKTYVAQKLARHLAGPEDRVTLVQFHPSYAYEDFVQGFRPATLKDGRPGFELRDGPLLRAAKEAREDEDPDARHFLIIDEINRGQIAKVFGELYFLLEYRDSEINLQYSDEPFSLPENLYIIGTMNTADRSIALVDLALRRRFYFAEFHPDDEPVKGVLRRWLEAKGLDHMEWVADVVERVNKKMEDDRHAAIGPSYFMKDNLDDEAVERIWKHSVLPYIEERRHGDEDSVGEFDLKALRREAQRTGVLEDGDPQEGDGGEENQGGGAQ